MKVFSRLNIKIKASTMSDEEIMKWLEEHDDHFKKDKYTIKNGVVDAKDDVYLYYSEIGKFPFQFGKIKGNFNCAENKLTSLKGCPKEVGGDFICSWNKLTSLKGCPKEVGGTFDCRFNSLTSLDGAPKEVGGYFNCSANKITSLEGCPQKVGGYFNCISNKITSLKGCPQKVGGYFNCAGNKITSLEGCPQKVGMYFDCTNNKLTSLKGCPKEVGGDFICRLNNDLNVTKKDIESICKVKGEIIGDFDEYTTENPLSNNPLSNFDEYYDFKFYDPEYDEPEEISLNVRFDNEKKGLIWDDENQMSSKAFKTAKDAIKDYKNEMKKQGYKIK